MSGIRCYFCGRFIGYRDEDIVGWLPETHMRAVTLDPPEPVPAHKGCAEAGAARTPQTGEGS